MNGERWLTEEQQHIWRAFLAMQTALHEQIEHAMQAAAGMPHTYYLILAMLSEAPDRSLRMSQLAEIAGVSPSRLSHAIARLEQQEFVTRKTAADDKRGQVAVLTDAGFQRLVEVAPSHAETVRSFMFDPLTAEQLKAFGEACEVIAEAHRPV